MTKGDRVYGLGSVLLYDEFLIMSPRGALEYSRPWDSI